MTSGRAHSPPNPDQQSQIRRLTSPIIAAAPSTKKIKKMK
jgi:hypothetical protein